MVIDFVDPDIWTSAGEEVTTDAEEALQNPRSPVANTDTIE